MTINRVTWTGGDAPTKADKKGVEFRSLRHDFFREYVGECGGLNLWACAGTSALERARIFWNRAGYDAYATLRSLTDQTVTK